MFPNNIFSIDFPEYKPVGSFISPETPKGYIMLAQALTTDGIIANHNLSVEQFDDLRQELFGMKLSDILYSYPDGVRYDITLNLVATCR